MRTADGGYLTDNFVIHFGTAEEANHVVFDQGIVWAPNNKVYMACHFTA